MPAAEPKIQPESGVLQYGDKEDILQLILAGHEWLEETLAKHTGQDVEKIRRDIEVDTFLTAPEAKEYGIVDEVLEHRQ